jgi:hypothetical protein
MWLPLDMANLGDIRNRNKILIMLKFLQTQEGEKKMKLKTLIALTLTILVGLTATTVAQDGPSDEELLGAMDFNRFGAFFAGDIPTTTFTTEIVAERPDGSKTAVVQVSFQIGEQGQFTARIDYLSPEELSGDVFLIVGDDILFWNPDLLTPLKVNGRFEVFGDATVAEVVGIFFQSDYNIVGQQPTTLEDGTAGLQLMLEANRESVAYPKAEVTANAETLQPISLKLFDESGDLLHDNTFEAYGNVNGVPYFETQLLDNRVVPVNQTLLTITNIENKELDATLFDPEFLGV